MFRTQDMTALDQVLGAFGVPMCVVQAEARAPFARIAANGLFHGLSATDDPALSLPGLDAPRGEATCAACFAGCVPTQYQATAGHRVWLLPLTSDGGQARIVVTLQPADDPRVTHHRARALEDASYFAFQTEFQISRALSLVEAMEERQGDGRLRSDLQVLAGLCRSAERGVMDVRNTVEPLIHGIAPQAPNPRPWQQPTRHSVRRCLEGMTMLFQLVG